MAVPISQYPNIHIQSLSKCQYGLVRTRTTLNIQLLTARILDFRSTKIIVLHNNYILDLLDDVNEGSVVSNHGLALVLGFVWISMVFASAFVPQVYAQPLPSQLRLEPGGHIVEIDLLPNTVHEENKVNALVHEDKTHAEQIVSGILQHKDNPTQVPREALLN